MRSLRVFISLLLVLGQIISLSPRVLALDVAIAPQYNVLFTHIVAGESASSSSELIVLYNNASSVVDITGWCIKDGDESGANLKCLEDEVLLAPYGYFTVSTKIFADSHSYMPGAQHELVNKLAVGGDTISLVDRTNVLVDKVTWKKDQPPTNGILERHPVLTCDGTITMSGFVSKNVFNSEDYPLSGEVAIIVEPDCEPAIECEGVRINEIGANLSKQFIELVNPTESTVALAGCLLQTNRSDKSYVFTQQELLAGEYLTIYIEDTDLTLTKTTTGEVYILSSDGLSETDVRTYSDLSEDTSWSWFVDDWRQTYALTPSAINSYEQYPPCEGGYYRNILTGRCNVIPTVTQLSPCDSDQYRSEETGRCRSLATATTRKPCRDDQYRSEETGRCRNLVLASARKPCKDNQYRSEETGRCRNLPATTVPAAGFAVQPVKESGMAFVGWWALGGVVLLAGAYGVWEWRRELTDFVHKLLRRS